MNKREFQKVVQRIMASDDLQELINRQQAVKTLIDDLNSSPAESFQNLKSYLESSHLFNDEDLNVEVGELADKKKWLEHLTVLNVRLSTQQKVVKEKQLRKMFDAKGYNVEDSGWNDFGLHIGISKRGVSRVLLVLSQEVMNDSTPEEILKRLEQRNWQQVVAENDGKNLYFTNNGFR